MAGGFLGKLCSVGIAAAFCLECRAEWQNALKPAGEPQGHLVAVQDGQPRIGILCTEDATLPDRKAARELQHGIQQITGATVPIYYGGAPGRNIIMRTDPSLGEDGYSVAFKNLQILLRGGTGRGMVNAVYALLEEDLGCRFYTHDSVRLPKTNTLFIAPVDRKYTPQLKLRDPYYACAFDPEWSLRNRTSSPAARVPEEFGGHRDYDGMFVHTAAAIVPPEKYLKSHPEYFAQSKDGKRITDQLCPNHPEVARLAVEHVRQTLRDHPHTEIVSISKNDNETVCHCDPCTNLRAEEGTDMANQLVLVNRVAEAIEREHPNLTMDTLAYLETIQVPKTMRPRKNVAIRLCNDRVGAWSQPFTPAQKCEIARHLTAWSAAHGRIYIWDYTVNFSHYLAPMPNLDVIAANIRFWVANRAEGVMLQGGYQGPAERDELKSWVAAKLLWNPDWDEAALVRDFLWGHYGKAAPAIADYEELLRQLRVRFSSEMASPAGGIRYPMDAPFITKEFVQRATALFLRARELAGSDPALIRRIERAELPVLYVQCARGPDFAGERYAEIVAAFERIARRENVNHLREGPPDFAAKLAEFRNQIPKPKETE